MTQRPDRAIASPASSKGLAPTPLRDRWVTLLGFALAVGVTGCRHKSPPLLLPQVAHAAPIELETPPEPASPPMIEAPPPPEPAPTAPASRPVPRRRPTPAAAAPAPPPPVQVASAEPAPAVAAIGSLSSGGDATPRSQQEAKDLIAAIQKRLGGLSAQTAERERDQIKTVRNFLVEAQKALDSGDAEGAKTLATKARVLMDEVEKQ